MKTAVLWDIDGTLLSIGPSVLHVTFSKVTGVSPLKSFKTHGMVDHEILVKLCKVNGVKPNSKTLTTLEEESLNLVKHWVSDGNRREELPGVRAVLEELDANSEVSQGLLTGNCEERAWMMLETADLNHYFSFGGFGGDSPNRIETARRAVATAPAHNHLVVVGDTPNDARCAKAIGARSVIVLSGAFTRAEIEAEEPDAILESFEDAETSVKAILD